MRGVEEKVDVVVAISQHPLFWVGVDQGMAVFVLMSDRAR